MELHDIALLAAKYVNSTDQHIFLTGKAGTGKTTFLKYIIDHTYKNTVVAAPTGIAAINAGGVTLHSLLQLPFGTFIPENVPLTESNTRFNTPQTIFRERKMHATKRKLLQELELLIIDEVSMLRADLLDCIDFVLRNVRRKSTPFGGVQILFIGDLMQLPPVVKEDEKRLLKQYYQSPFFFHANALEHSPPIRVELQKIYRQTDQDFIDLLNRLRHNEQSDSDVAYLNTYYKTTDQLKDQSGYINLTTHNYKADSINEKRLEQLEGKIHYFDATIKGDFPENMYPTVSRLILKEGAQVMFIKNDPSGEGAFFNGKIGTISRFADGNIYVQCDGGSEIEVETYTWENKRYTLNKATSEIEEKNLGAFEQFPIKLAWAVTIHKSQGLTFEKAILDLEGTFAPGQLYVALSRLTSLNGLIMASPLPRRTPDIESVLVDFAKSFHNKDELKSELDRHRKGFILKFIGFAYNFDQLSKELWFHLKGFNKEENRSIKQQYLEWTTEFHRSIDALKEIGMKFMVQADKIIQSEDNFAKLHERVTKANDFFVPKLILLKQKLHQHKTQLKDKKKVKGYIGELEEIDALIFHYMKQMTKFGLFLEKTIEDKDLTREMLRKTLIYRAVKEEEKPVQKDKTPTALISYEMYKKGKTVEEIAIERGLVPATIHGHLCQYVTSGDIDATELIDSKKLSDIITIIESGVEKSGEIKALLSNDYTYGEIKVAIAHSKGRKKGD